MVVQRFECVCFSQSSDLRILAKTFANINLPMRAKELQYARKLTEKIYIANFGIVMSAGQEWIVSIGERQVVSP